MHNEPDAYLFFSLLQWVPIEFPIMFIAILSGEMLRITCVNYTSKNLLTMQSYMFAGSYYLQIFNPIIYFVAIYMMNMFMRFKRTAKMFFHNKTMHWYGFTRYILLDISILIRRDNTFLPKNFVGVALRTPTSIMHLTKTFSIIGFFATFNRTISDNIGLFIRRIYSIATNIIISPHIVIITETLTMMFFGTNLNRTFLHGIFIPYQPKYIKENCYDI